MTLRMLRVWEGDLGSGFNSIPAKVLEVPKMLRVREFGLDKSSNWAKVILQKPRLLLDFSLENNKTTSLILGIKLLSKKMSNKIF